MMMDHADRKAYGIIAAVSYLGAVLVFHEFLFAPGVVNAGDLVWPYFRSQSHEYTSTLYQLPNHVPFFELLWSIPVSAPTLQRVLYLSVYTLVGTVGGSVVYRFVSETVAVDRTTATRLGVLGSLLYLLNPMNVFYASQIFLPLGYALYPLVIYLAYSAHAAPRGSATRYGVLLGLVLAATSGDPRWPVWGFVSVGILLAVLTLIEEPSTERVLESLKFVGVAGVCFSALSAFWLVPLLHPGAATEVNPLTNQNPLTKQMIDMLNAHATWANAFRFHADWWPPIRDAFVPVTSTWRAAWYVSGIALPLVALVSLLLRRKRIVPVAVLYSCLLLAVTAPTSSFEGVRATYDWLAFTVPFGGAFRTSFKILLPASFPAVLMASVAVGELLSGSRERSKVLGGVLLVLLLVSVPANSWLLLTGNMGDHRDNFDPTQLSEDGRQTYQQLRAELGDRPVLAFPNAPSGGLPMRSVGRDSFRERLPELEMDGDNSTRNAVLRQMSVEYMLDYRPDSGMKPDRVEGARRTAYVPDTVISGYLSDSHPIHQSFGLTNTSIATGYGATGSEFRVVSDSKTKLFDSGNVVRPYEHVRNWNPQSGWARTTLSTRYVRNRLDGKTLDGVQPGRRMVVAATNRSLREPAGDVEPKPEDRVDHWTFESPSEDEATFTTPNTASTAVEVRNGRLAITVNESTASWKVVNSPKIRADEDDRYRFEMSMRGVDVHDAHLKVSEFSSNGTQLRTERVSGGGDGTFRKQLRFSYEPRSRNVSYVRLEIWQGYETSEPLPNRLWLDDVDVYDMSRYMGPVSMEIPFRVGEDGNFTILGRYVRNSNGGAVRVLVDGQSRIIETGDQLSGLEEQKIGTFELEEGRHTLTLVNVNGSNVVTGFSIFQAEKYEEQRRTRQRALANETLIHLLDAETDLYVNDAVPRDDRNDTDDGLVEMRDGTTALRTIDVQTNGSYRPAIRGVGNFTVQVGNRTYEVESDEGQLQHLGPVELTAGQHEIRVIAKNQGQLDTLWLYTAESNRTLDEILSNAETDARVESVERVSPTKYEVEVDANEPYVLSFAEDYSPLWVAEVQTPNGTEQVEPVPLYAAINGFQIDETGEYTVTLRYRQQRWFENGLAVSLVALAGCLAYLGYDWRRRRNHD